MADRMNNEMQELVTAEMLRMAPTRFKNLLVNGPKTPLDERMTELFWEAEARSSKAGAVDAFTALGKTVRKERSIKFAQLADKASSLVTS
jgi:hypothetical protein